MTRYWVSRYAVMPSRDDAENITVEIILASDLPAHDALLRAQVLEEAATQLRGAVSRQGAMLSCDSLPRIADHFDAKAAALRQRAGK